MPIGKKWSRATPRHVRSNVPSKSGVYELKAFGKLVYIGQAKNLQRRLLEHLNARDPNYFRFETAGFLQSRRNMERDHLNRYGNSTAEMPPWNQQDPRR